MKRMIIAIVILGLSIFLLVQFTSKTGRHRDSEQKSNNKIVRTDITNNGKVVNTDSNSDGVIDGWLYRDKEEVPLKWIRDSNHDGHPDHWSFFKNGRAFLDEVDTDHDGKVDMIYSTIWDSQGIKQRSFSFVVQDKETNVFVLHEDTDWKSDDTDLKSE